MYYDPEPVRVLMHLNGGYTKVLLERIEGQGLVDGGIEWEIPTHKIPFHLRKIGSRFLLIHRASFSTEDDVENLREKGLTEIDIQEIDGTNNVGISNP